MRPPIGRPILLPDSTAELHRRSGKRALTVYPTALPAGLTRLPCRLADPAGLLTRRNVRLAASK